MVLKLIEPKKSKGETGYKTQIKVTHAEIESPTVKAYLMKLGIDWTEPEKESSKFLYFVCDGDKLNKRRGA